MQIVYINLSTPPPPKKTIYQKTTSRFVKNPRSNCKLNMKDIVSRNCRGMPIYGDWLESNR